jgi:hypothetical protein
MFNFGNVEGVSINNLVKLKLKLMSREDLKPYMHNQGLAT